MIPTALNPLLTFEDMVVNIPPTGRKNCGWDDEVIAAVILGLVNVRSLLGILERFVKNSVIWKS